MGWESLQKISNQTCQCSEGKEENGEGAEKKPTGLPSSTNKQIKTLKH